MPKPNRRGFIRNAHEVAAMKARIDTDTLTAVKVLRAVYERQDPGEQFKQQHSGFHDGWGFQPHHTTALCRIYERLEARGWTVYPHEADAIRAKMIPYAEQYIDHEEERKREAQREYRQRREAITDDDRAAARRAAQEKRSSRASDPLWGAMTNDAEGWT